MDKYYVDGHGDTLTIETVKFYLTHVALGMLPPPPGRPVSSVATIPSVHQLNPAVYKIGIEIKKSFLFNAEDSNAYSFTADAIGDFNGILFTLGVDSADNTSGANEDALDPINGMYWAWNSGYIMAKLEGRSNVCHTLHHAFEFHIGGYMPPYNTARAVHLDLPQPVTVKNGENVLIKINADVAAWLKGNLDLSRINSIVIPGKEASLMADKYAQMFSVTPNP